MTAVLSGLFFSAATVLSGAAATVPARADVAAVAPHHVAVSMPSWCDDWCGGGGYEYDEWYDYEEWHEHWH
jgi:hypothetical protein